MALSIPPRHVADPGALTPAEEDTLRLFAQGLTNREVARHLGASIKTIDKRLAVIRSKLGVETKARAVEAWLGRRVA